MCLPVSQVDRSLREFDTEAIVLYLSDLPEITRRHAITGFKRFVKFMRETSRLDWDEAEDMLFLLKVV